MIPPNDPRLHCGLFLVKKGHVCPHCDEKETRDIQKPKDGKYDYA